MRKGWGYALVAVATGLALSIGLVVRRWDFDRASDDLDDAARAYRAAGLPWTAADLGPNIPRAANAAPMIYEALDALPSGKRRLRLDTSSTDLNRYAAAMRLTHEAVKRPAIDLGIDRDLGLHMRFRFAESANADELALDLAARAAWRSARGDDTGALADLEDARRLGKLVGLEPSLMGVLTSASCGREALQGARDCLISAAARPERLVRYRAWLAAPLPEPDLHQAWRGEIYQTVAIARNLSREQAAGFLLPGLGIDPWRAPSVKPLRRTGLPEDLFARAFMARCLRLNTELSNTTHGLTDSIDRVTEIAQAIRERAARSEGLSGNLDALLFPVYRLRWTRTQSLALRAVDLVFADALILHAKTGHWPTGSSILDPLGTGPLKVRFDGKRFRVWSVGRNGKDEGGLLPHEKNVDSSSDDIVAAYPPIPPARRSPPSPYNDG